MNFDPNHGASNVVSLQSFREQQPEDPFYEGCARLARDYDETSVTLIVARYRETLTGVHYQGLEFEFDWENQPRVLPSPELLGRTLELFANLFARMTADNASDPEDTDLGEGSFRWNLVWNQITNHHTVTIPMRRPVQNEQHEKPTFP